MLNTSLAIRCRSCTPASAAELTRWLEDKVAEMREEEPQLLVRITQLAQALPSATVDDGWLIEVELQGERPEEPFASLMASLTDMLCDMQVLGLDPTLLVPVKLPMAESPLSSTAEGSLPFREVAHSR